MKKMKNDKGTVTLEACIVVPMFIILMLAVCGLIVLFMGQQVVTHAAIQSAKSMAFDPYATERSASAGDEELSQLFSDVFTLAHNDYTSTRKWYSDESHILSTTARSRFLAYISEDDQKCKDILDNIGIVGGAYGISFSDCNVEDGVLTMKVNYTQKFLFDAGGLGVFDRSVAVKVRLFTYAKMGGLKYEVSFDSNGGKSISNRVTNESNDALPKTTKNGYIFMGWSTEKNATTPNVTTLEEAKEHGAASNGVSNLYAVWQKAPTLTYNLGSVGMGEHTVKVDTDIQKLIDAGLKMKVTISYTANVGGNPFGDAGDIIDYIGAGTSKKQKNHGWQWWGETVKVSHYETFEKPQQSIKIGFVTGSWLGAASYKVSNLKVKIEFV